MKFYPFLIMLFIFLTNSSEALAAPKDSTKLSPPNVKPLSQVTVNVLHFAMNVPYNGQTAKCAEGELIGSYHFFAENTNVMENTTPGYYFFTCKETYWPNDPFYTNLKNNNWVACANNMNCSIKIQKPPLIRFIIKIPPNAAQTYSTFYTMTFNDAEFYLDSNSYPLRYARKLYVYKLAGGGGVYSSGIHTWVYGGKSATPVPPTNDNLIFLYWNLKGPSWSTDTSKSSFRTSERHGVYICGANNPPNVNDVLGFTLAFPRQTFGATCTITCLGPYEWKGNFARDASGNIRDTMLTTTQDVHCDYN